MIKPTEDNLPQKYTEHGWKLVSIPNKTKGPDRQGWNREDNCITDYRQIPDGFGVGLAHAYSGTMALDIDEWRQSYNALSALGINLKELQEAHDAVGIDSGSQGRAKLLYRMPPGKVLTSKQVHSEARDNKGRRKVIYELRCATSTGLTTQDILPPSIHPSGQPYRWCGRGHWSQLPMIPQALLDHWENLIDRDTRLVGTAAVGQIDATWAEIKEAVAAIDPSTDREEWIQIGMSLHWTAAQTGEFDKAFGIWDTWSKTSEKYPGDRGMITQWNSFKTDRDSMITLGTLFTIANRYDYERPLPPTEHLFGPINAAKEELIMEPQNILDAMRPPAPNINLDLFPPLLRERAKEVSSQVGCDPLVPLFAGLSAVCAVANAKTRLELVEGFKVPPVLWLMTLGNPADKKSPGSRPMLSPLKNIESDDRPRFADEMLKWEGQEAMYASSKKAFLEWAASPDALLGDDTAPQVQELPEQPVPLRLTVSDITSQKLVRNAEKRPEGFLCYLDEMSSWVSKMVDSRSGEDRSCWVVSYEGQHYEMDRVGAGSIHCENLAVSIYGNIQPKVFKRNIESLSADGLLQRFVPAVLRPKETRLGQPVPEWLTHTNAWESMLRLIHGMAPRTIQLSPDGYQEFRAFQAWYESAKQDERILNRDENNDAYMTAFGKLEGTVGRFILIFHLMENPFSNVVDVDIVKRVVQLAKTYLIPSYRYVMNEVAGLSVNTLDLWLTEHIIHISDNVQYITLADLKRSGRRKLEGRSDWQKDNALMDSMLMLEQAGWVQQVECDLKRHHCKWGINPSIATMFEEYRLEVIKAKQRHNDMIYELGSKSPKWKGRKLIRGYDPETMD